LEQVEAFLEMRGVQQILLDNMSLDEMRKAIDLRKGGTPYFEASGGITLEKVAAIAGTGVDFISVGAITHSALSLDLGLDFVTKDDK
jgi:nicotinate-nucleotide pyrophosphorylase (carboxylating)